MDLYILGHDDKNARMLERALGENHKDVKIRPLLKLEEIRKKYSNDLYPVEEVLSKCEKRLKGVDPAKTAIIGYFDFPVTLIVSLLNEKFDLRGPRPQAVFSCEHKYWARKLQKEVIEDTPEFQLFDPFASDPLSQVRLDYPFWIKPVKSYLAQLAYKVENPKDLESAVKKIKERIGNIGLPFNKLLEKIDLPNFVSPRDGLKCILEQDAAGRSLEQCTLEGYYFDGKIRNCAIVDSPCYPDKTVFRKLQYPSKLPERVQKEMKDKAEKVVRKIGLIGGFNIEFFWDQEHNKVSLLEINPRSSQSYGKVFEYVDGKTNLEAMAKIALGGKPSLGNRMGRFAIGAKFMLRFFEDGVVTKAPSQEDARRVERQVEACRVELKVKEGTILSETPEQDSYSYLLAEVFLGASDEEALERKYEWVLNELPFKIESSRKKGRIKAA